MSLEAKNAIRSRVGRGIMAKTKYTKTKLVLSETHLRTFCSTSTPIPYGARWW